MNIEEYASFFEHIKKETPLEEYKSFFVEDVYFKDPFHEFNGVEKIYNVFQNMFKQLDNPHFNILEIIENQNVSYIKWVFSYKFKNSKKLEIFEGVSRVQFNDKNKVISHVDYWDAGENIYEKLPVLSTFISFVKRKIRG